jgi:hypothetical protein
MRGVVLLLVLTSCGKVAGDESSTNDDDPAAIDGGPEKQAQDAGSDATTTTSAFDASMPFSPINTSTWLAVDATSSCSFEYRFDEENAPPYFVTGSRVIARVQGTEIPYVGFGCTGTIANQTITFIGGALGTDNPQWAWINVSNFSYWIYDEQVFNCDLTENAAHLGTLGSEVSGTFSCTNIPGSPAPISISNGKYDTVFSTGELSLP